MIKWGIIGCGDVTEIKSGPAFNKASQSELLAVMRRNVVKAKDYAERHQVPNWSNDAAVLLENPKISAIYVASPPKFHLEYALKALENNKDVYLEKPMVMNTQEAGVLRRAVNASKNKLVVAHYRRYLPMFLEIKRMVNEDVLGTVKNIDLKFCQPERNDVISKTEDQWRLQPELSGGGLFYDIAPHQLDLMYYLFGRPVSYFGMADNEEDPSTPNEIIEGTIQFENGIEFNGFWNFKSDSGPLDRCVITGENGFISFALFGNKIEFEVNGQPEVLSFEHPENIQLPMIQQTVEYFLGKVDNPCSVEEGCIVSEIMDKFSKSG